MSTELEKSGSERKIMPDDIFESFIRGRRNTWAANAPEIPIEERLIPDMHELRDHAENSPYYYHDHFKDAPERPGNFYGFDVVSVENYLGKQVVTCTYGGGLNERGLALGEGPVYGALKEALKQKVAEARFGRKVTAEITTKHGTFRFEDDGIVKPWGWEGSERIYYGDELVYEGGCRGMCFIPGF